MSQPVLRFAPSPNGHLHLGHAYSALLNAKLAQQLGGRFLVRIEDIDKARCTQTLIDEMFEDLTWLGVTCEEPVRRQSEHFEAYAEALAQLEATGLVYRAYASRAQVKAFISTYEETGRSWPRDPDGAPLYPPEEAILSPETLASLAADPNAPFALRLDMAKALKLIGAELFWQELVDLNAPAVSQKAHPELWGDVVLARKDTPTSYHLSVVLDDALQGITHVVRGQDLYHATSVHRLLQELLGLPAPTYHHHKLILDDDGRKLAKSNKSTSLRSLREQGTSAPEIRQMLGFA
ncbi:tRNA glutamyl-Q(34) synthetase GluQRS [Rhodobacteraceae bacterium RKSG542]|uniref:tRNA glutamyl-Q(34) synthetase GluQRS n=1 Tax=Pseudovibrio flavus TaxID=2529854 RepID=UPI0012BB5108|nr:tRNA glutamyl-Q(34) synthetase GluQRS [Pseudovibrio flavus]MTI18383.1 tRNA glutamyl-Q(34) synthetase GluQRS [Pseudovibrio flavus]